MKDKILKADESIYRPLVYQRTNVQVIYVIVHQAHRVTQSRLRPTLSVATFAGFARGPIRE